VPAPPNGGAGAPAGAYLGATGEGALTIISRLHPLSIIKLHYIHSLMEKVSEKMDPGCARTCVPQRRQAATVYVRSGHA
jgi:hypothetical protein